MQEYLSPLRYPGGKTLIAKFISNVILYNNLEGCDYYEPFAGGGGAGLFLLSEGIVKRLYLNDADRSIYAFWHSVLKNTDHIIEEMENTDATIEEWIKQKEIYKNEKENLLKLGFAAFFLNRCNRSGVIPTGGPIGGYEQKGKWKVDVRYNKAALISRIRKIADMADRITFTNSNAINILKKLKNKNNFTYIDPPYYTSGSNLYLNYFCDEDHIYLSKIIKGMSHKNWILTYDNCDFIKHLYRKKNIKMHSFNLNYSLQNKRIGQELLILPDAMALPSQIRVNNNLQKLNKIFA